jgi:MATE family multidrug resistance protein
MGNSLIQGLATGLDTLAAQAYGSGQKHLVGLHTQRMTFFILPCVLPLMVLWWHADKMLALMLPERKLAELAGTYLKIMSFRIPAFVFFECGKRYLQVQGIFSATSYILLITAPLNALLMWLFVWHLGWGFVGAPIAIVITENLMTLMLVLYVWLINGSECWGGLDKKAWSNWGKKIVYR